MKKPIYIVGALAVALVFIGAGCTSGCTSLTGDSSGLSQYTGKTFDISSTDGKVKGSVELKENDGGLLAYYHFLLNDKLKVEVKCPSEPNLKCREGVFGYEYAVTMEGDVSTDYDPYVITTADVYCNENILPTEELNKSQSSLYYYTACHDGQNIGYETDTFYMFLAPYYNSYEDFLSTNTFTLYKASDYWEEDDETGYMLNQDKAVAEGEKYKSYTFEIVE